MAMSRFNKISIIVAVSTVAVLSSLIITFAADIRPHVGGSFKAIVIEGEIVRGDFELFEHIVKENQGQLSSVIIYSPGGDFFEAMKIGRAIRALELGTLAPPRNTDGRPLCEADRSDVVPIPKSPDNCTCASAGFMIYLGGTSRGGKYLAAHRPYFGKGVFEKLLGVEAKKAFEMLQQSATEYMQEMGVPKHLQDEILATPSDRALLFDEKTIATYFSVDQPYLHEWSINKCVRPTAQEKAQYNEYMTRIMRAKERTDQLLSSEELEDMKRYQKKDAAMLKCSVDLGKKRLAEAYTKYFGMMPSDITSRGLVKQ